MMVVYTPGLATGASSWAAEDRDETNPGIGSG